MAIGEKVRGFVERRRTEARQRKCPHDWAVVWEDDYREHVLHEEPTPFRPLNFWGTRNICRRCGKVTEGPSIPVEEVMWADRALISHFQEPEG